LNVERKNQILPVLGFDLLRFWYLALVQLKAQVYQQSKKEEEGEGEEGHWM
jgi:hypothetical protein